MSMKHFVGGSLSAKYRVTSHKAEIPFYLGGSGARLETRTLMNTCSFCLE